MRWRPSRLIFENLENAYEHGNNIQAREHMLTAAFLAGRSFSKSYVGYVHAVAHSLGGRYNIPHGLANAVLLPIVLRSTAPASTASSMIWRWRRRLLSG